MELDAAIPNCNSTIDQALENEEYQSTYSFYGVGQRTANATPHSLSQTALSALAAEQEIHNQQFSIDSGICDKFAEFMEIRKRYQNLSFQAQGQNPKDFEDFVLDPPLKIPLIDSASLLNSNNYNKESSYDNENANNDIVNNNNSSILVGIYNGNNSNGVSYFGAIDDSNASLPLTTNKSNTYKLSEYDLTTCLIPGGCEDVWKLCEDGVFRIYEPNNSVSPKNQVPTIKEYYATAEKLINFINDGPSRTFSFRRLRYLECQFNLYVLLNEQKEVIEQKKVPHRDFYNIRKVDTHVHHTSSMNSKHLLRFIKSKLKKAPNDVVIYRDKKYLTLAQVFESLHLTVHDLSIDTLDVHAHKDSFHRFDNFNLKYNPIGESRLREIFLKTDNYINGRYLSELSKEVISDLEHSKYQNAEYRISIYGKNIDEWDKLAAWVCDNHLFSDNVRWLIQIPRLYSVYKEMNIVTCFQDLVRNIFQPLFEVSKDPTSHPKLHIFLQRVVGFDSVDDESKPEKRIHKKFPFPLNWNSNLNPPYSYYLYYMYSNIASLNYLRSSRNFNTFVLRPHSGEAGDPEHLAYAFLTSQGISHGILLRKVPVLQYLFYLMQIGIAMSPLSNNALFLTYDRNPFPAYFARGLNVSLSTDDPLQFHFTREPLIEEYSIAAQIWKLSSADMSEICRNSVLQSGFEGMMKKKWLGSQWAKAGSNDIKKTNIPDVRIEYRHKTLLNELSLISSRGQSNLMKPSFCVPGYSRAHSPNPTTYQHFENKK